MMTNLKVGYVVFEQGLGVTDVLFGSNKDKGNQSLNNKDKEE